MTSPFRFSELFTRKALVYFARKFVLLFLAVFSASLLHATDSPLIVSWIPSSTHLTNWNELHTKMHAQFLKEAMVHTWELAVVSSDQPEKAARISLDPPFYSISKEDRGHAGTIGTLSNSNFAQLNSLGDGKYQCAILLNGARCSNVFEVTIDHTYNPSKSPVLTLKTIDWPNEDSLNEIAVFVTAPKDANPPLKTNCFVESQLVVDGTLRNPVRRLYFGPVGVLEPGHTTSGILQLSNYSPAIQSAKSHRIQVLVGSYQSEEVSLTIDPATGEAFDKFWVSNKPTQSKH